MNRNKKYYSVILSIFVLSFFLASCGKPDIKFQETEELDRQEREEVNAMQGTFSSDGNCIYMSWMDFIYRVNLETREMQMNCGDFLCGHEDSNCSARLAGDMAADSVLCRNGKHVYLAGDKIYEIDKNKKREIGHGGYGGNGVRILFGDYIAYFDKESVVVVKEIESDEEVQRFEDIRGFMQGNFYHKGFLYYVTDENQLVRLDLNTGNKEILEKKGATRASVYNGAIYYIKVSIETDTNWIIKMNPDTLEKQELVEGAFYYNMLGDSLYYSTWPEQSLYCSDLNGENRRELSSGNDYTWSFIWAFPQAGVLLLNGDDTGTVFYLLDAANGEIDYDEPLIRPGNEEEDILDRIMGE